MDDEPPPAAPQAFVWLLLEIAPQIGHKLTVGAFSSQHEAERARARAPQTLSMCRVPLDQQPARM